LTLNDVHAGTNVICPDRAQDYPSPRLLTPLPSQMLVKRQSTHIVARYKESQIFQVRTPESNDRDAMRPLPRKGGTYGEVGCMMEDMLIGVLNC